MDNIKSIATGAVITLLIGGTAYTFSQKDVIDNFAEDTGLTQEQAEQYINEISEDDLVTFDVLGQGHIDEGKDISTIANDIDCANYEYEWESFTLSCSEGKSQLNTFAHDSNTLGQAYIKLNSDSATDEDISKTMTLIDTLNADYDFEIISVLWDWATIDESKKTNSFNKALLKAALESEE